jgi:ABC-type transporter Mla subunit MlaD
LSTVTVDKSEWDAFLAKFSELSKKYELVLKELDSTKAHIKTLTEQWNRQKSRNEETLRRVGEAVSRLCDQAESFLNDTKRE